MPNNFLKKQCNQKFIFNVSRSIVHDALSAKKERKGLTEYVITRDSLRNPAAVQYHQVQT